MALSRDAYQELEDVLGPENISEDLAVIEGYTFQPFPLEQPEGNRFYVRPEAVVLPGSTEDVQKIMRVCNRRGIKSKAFGTGYGAFGAARSENTIILDLRRMNRILELDEKNMRIVVEPYVSFAQVQGEAMKRGLCCNMIGAGSQCSFLASFTSMHGNGILAISNGYSGRNLLGAEWVLPTGEVLRVGSVGSGTGWFYGDGPGPSLRGILRGAMGACGGLGVFTKCAGHLHPWPGPREMDVKGISPNYETEIPSFFEYHICEFETWEQFGEAIAQIGKAGIAYALHKTGGPGSHGGCVTGNNNEYYERRKAGELQIPFKSFSIVLAAHTQKQHEYQRKVLDMILERTGGKISLVGEEPGFKNVDYINMIKACFIPRLAFRLCGTFGVDGIIAMEAMDHMVEAMKWDEQHRNKHAKEGVIMDDGTLNSWAIAYEGSHFALAECGHPFSSIDKDIQRRVGQMIGKGREQCMKAPYSLSWGLIGEEIRTLGPTCSNYTQWMRKIKKTFDPNAASDPFGYISAEED